MRCLHIIFAVFIVSGPGTAATEHPGNIRTVFGIDPDIKAGEQALYAGDHELAIKKLLAGLPKATSPHDTAMTLNNLCAAYSLAGDFDTSLDYCDQALRVKENAWQAHQNRARSLIGQGKILEAIAAAERGLEIAPNSALLHQTLALANRLNVRPHVIIDTFETQRDSQ